LGKPYHFVPISQFVTTTQKRKYDNHPRERVTWYGAVAFCRWLSDKLGYEVRLPTEWEWQQAATGGEADRAYPWGPDWKEDHTNSQEAGIGQTSAVGMFPAGASPVGALDMTGNVWEWCLNEYNKPSNTGLGGEEWRVLRGGSWYSDKRAAGAAFRNLIPPIDWYDGDFGMRVVCGRPHLGK
jgi:formylglycine-generating enzyme required for sulfatase activity